MTASVPLPPPRCANCVFRHDDGLCYRRGVNSGFYDWQKFTPSPCFAGNACFHHQYKRARKEMHPNERHASADL